MAAIPKLHAPPHTRLAAIAGTPPDPMRLGARLSVRAALRLRAGTLSERGAAARRPGGGTPICLLVPARCASTSERVMAGQRNAHSSAPSRMLLSVEHLVVEYGAGAYRVHAVSDVSFDLKRGETLGLGR